MMGGQQTSPPQVDPNAIPEDPLRRFLPRSYATQLSGGLKPLDPRKAAANLAAEQESLQTPSIAGELAQRDLGPGYARSFGPKWGPKATQAVATIAPLMATAGLGGGMSAIKGLGTAEEAMTGVESAAQTGELVSGAATEAFPKRPPLQFNSQGDPAMTMPMPGGGYSQYQTVSELYGRQPRGIFPPGDDRFAIRTTRGDVIKAYETESYDDLLARMEKAHHKAFPGSPDIAASMQQELVQGQRGFVKSNGEFYTGAETTELERPVIPGQTQPLEARQPAAYQRLLQKLQSSETQPMTLYDPRPGTPETGKLMYGTSSLGTMESQVPRYHGTANPIMEMSHAMEGQSNLYSMHGPGFYTTDDFDVASGYAQQRGGVWNPVARRFEGGYATGPVYRVYETKPNMRFLHIEDEVPRELESALIRHDSNWWKFFHDPYTKPEETYVESLYSMGNMESVFGDQEAESRMQEAVGMAQSLGYDGVEHTGGMRSGGAPHNVKIYWDPENQIRIRATDPWSVGEAPMMQSSTPEAKAAVKQMARKRQQGDF